MPPASRRGCFRSPIAATANWRGASLKPLRAKAGRSKSCTPRKGVWTRSFAASRCPTRRRRNRNEQQSKQHQSNRETRVDRLFLVAGGLRFPGDLFTLERFLYVHGGPGAVF